MNAVPWTAGGLIAAALLFAALLFASILFASLLFVGSWVRAKRDGGQS